MTDGSDPVSLRTFTEFPIDRLPADFSLSPKTKTNSEHYEDYKVRVLPWGVTCKEWESKLKETGHRPAWDRRAGEIQKERGVPRHEALYEAHLDYSPERLAAMEVPLSATDVEFVAKCREGLRMRLPERAGIEKELDWVGANAYRPLPNLETVPSHFVLNFLIAARENPKVLDNFWATSWSKRLAPGDSKSKKQSSVTEDKNDSEAEDHEAQLRARLFGE